MTAEKLHIISFDNPYPPTYGGAIDVFYRIKALTESGVKIILHCFYKGSLHRSEILENLCEAVYYYPRKTSILQQFHFYPYGVVSRTHPDLLPRLLQDDAPILFEGLVSCGLIAHPALRSRRKYFRECNVEHEYYHALGNASQSWSKKLFFHIEAERMRWYERNIRYADGIFALAHQDEAYFRQHYSSITTYIPCFHGHKQVHTPPEQVSPYILYHGNLQVAENNLAAGYIIEHMADSIHAHIIIAGNKPTEHIRKMAMKHSNIEIIDSPDEASMEKLIRNAQVHLLLTFQPTGVKLKLLNVLYAGGHVVVNPHMVTGTDISELCHIGYTDSELIDLCNYYISQDFLPEERAKRQSVLDYMYNDISSAQQIRKSIFSV